MLVPFPFVPVMAAAPTAAVDAPRPFGPVPSDRQLAWQRLQFTGFLHFTVNTFTDREWGAGDEDPNLFAPTDFDADQIVRTAREAGMTGLILTCKHHDGFCLWPTDTTRHSVRSSAWQGGKGDVVRAISQACRRNGLRFGVYLSPWDRNAAKYGGPDYPTMYRAQLRELLTRYGPIFEVWHDGANGGDGYYGGAHETRTIDKHVYYGWPETWAMIRKLQPNAVIFSDVGPDVRWVGNEAGLAGDPCWTTLTTDGWCPGDADSSQLNAGHRGGKLWLPAECDVSIRPGWFYHAAEDERVKSPAQLLDIWYGSVGRGANLLINLPPDRRGRVHEADVAALRGFRAALDATFAHDLARGAGAAASQVRGASPRFAAARLADGRDDTYWATDDAVTAADATLDLGKPTAFSVVRIREEIRLGQRVDDWAVDAWIDGDWKELARGSAIGAQRLIRLPSAVTAPRVRLRIIKAAACPAISELALFLEPGR